MIFFKRIGISSKFPGPIGYHANKSQTIFFKKTKEKCKLIKQEKDNFSFELNFR